MVGSNRHLLSIPINRDQPECSSATGAAVHWKTTNPMDGVANAMDITKSIALIGSKFAWGIQDQFEARR